MKKEFLLFSNYPDSKYFEETRAFMVEELDLEPSDQDVLDQIRFDEEIQWDGLKYELKNNTQAQQPCVVTGQLGLWHGNVTIEPKVFDNIYGAVMACVHNMDYITIKQINGYIEVNCTHHDGTNVFEIHLLNNKGIKATENYNSNADLLKKHYHKAIKGYIF